MVRKMLLDQSERSYIVKSGHITPLALYKLLYEHMDDIVVLDDVEGVLRSDIAVGILKAGLWDVMGDGKREITWASSSEKLGDTPMSFCFKGGLVLLCNKIPRKYDSTVKALRSRGFELSIHLTYKEKLGICKQLIESKDFYKISGVKLTNKEMNELKNALSEHTSVLLEDFNFRTVVKLIKFYKYNKTFYPENKGLYITLLNETSNIDKRKKLVWDLMNNDELTTVEQQIRIFIAQTGMSKATYYRIKRDLEEK